MYEKFHREGIDWYHFESITKNKDSKEKFLILAEEKNISRYIQKNFYSDLKRDRTSLSERHLFISFELPDLFGKFEKYRKQEIKIIMGKDFLITSSIYPDQGLKNFKNHFNNLESFDSNKINCVLPTCVVYYFVYLIEKIYENLNSDLLKIREEIEEIEEEIFTEKEFIMVKKISLTNRRLLDFRKILRAQKTTWHYFFEISKNFFEKESSHNAIDSIVLSHDISYQNAEELKEMLWELRDTNNSLLSSKQAEASKTFTLIAFLTLPITLFISIISLPTNQSHLFLGHKNDFTLTIIISLLLFSLTLYISRRKKWW